MIKLPITAEEFALKCEELWRNVAIAYVSASNSSNKYSMKEWADQAVEDYRKSFSYWNPTN
jgi:hypothetical protein